MLENGTPWHSWGDERRLTGVPKKSLCQQTTKFAATPLVLTPSVRFRLIIITITFTRYYVLITISYHYHNYYYHYYYYHYHYCHIILLSDLRPPRLAAPEAQLSTCPLSPAERSTSNV